MLKKSLRSTVYGSLFLWCLGLLAWAIAQSGSPANAAPPVRPAAERFESEGQVLRPASADEETGLGLQESAYAALPTTPSPAPARSRR